MAEVITQETEKTQEVKTEETPKEEPKVEEKPEVKTEEVKTEVPAAQPAPNQGQLDALMAAVNALTTSVGAIAEEVKTVKTAQATQSVFPNPAIPKSGDNSKAFEEIAKTINETMWDFKKSPEKKTINDLYTFTQEVIEAARQTA